MAILDGIEVQIQVVGRPSIEYDDPESATEPHSANLCTVKYIEAAPGATFSIYLSTRSGFTFEGGNLLHTKIELDNRTPTSYLLRRDHLPYDMKRLTTFCEESGKWMESSLAFGSLSVAEDNDAVSDLEPLIPSVLSGLGIITITLERGKRHKLRRPQPHPKFLQEPRIKQVSEKLLKGKTVTSSIDMVEQTVCRAPRAITHGWDPLLGDAGRKVTFKFIYRSRSALQALGCIPRDPSPEPRIEEPEEVTEANVAVTEESKESRSVAMSEEQAEMERLRARLSFLENKSQVKSEGQDQRSSNSSAVKREGPGNDSSKGSRKRQQIRRPTEYVDLTED